MATESSCAFAVQVVAMDEQRPIVLFIISDDLRDELPLAPASAVAALLDDPKAMDQRENVALIRYNTRGNRGASIRTQRFRYTERRAMGTGRLVASKLYDHLHDDAENRNEAGNSNYAADIARLHMLFANQKLLRSGQDE